MSQFKKIFNNQFQFWKWIDPMSGSRHHTWFRTDLIKFEENPPENDCQQLFTMLPNMNNTAWYSYNPKTLEVVKTGSLSPLQLAWIFMSLWLGELPVTIYLGSSEFKISLLQENQLQRLIVYMIALKYEQVIFGCNLNSGVSSANVELFP